MLATVSEDVEPEAEVSPLVSTREIRDMLGVSRQRVQQLIARPDFPTPAGEFAIKVWYRADIERWARERQMRLAGGEEAGDQ